MSGRKPKAPVAAPLIAPEDQGLLKEAVNEPPQKVALKKTETAEAENPNPTTGDLPQGEFLEKTKTSEEIFMKNSIQDGNTITIKPTADIKGGDLVLFSGMVAVAITDLAADEEGAAAASGVYELPKDNTALALGQAVFATSAGVVTATEGGNVPAGKCWADATGGEAIALVKINI